MDIPLLTSEEFLNDRLGKEIANIRGLSLAEFKDTIDNSLNPKNLNKKAENYISLRLGNVVRGLTSENWLTLKEYFFHWKAYEGVEFEDVSIDKKNSLDELLNAILEGNVNKSGETSVNRLVIS